MRFTDTEFAHICRARDRLLDLSESYWPIEKVAREAGISHFHFIRRFQAMFGTTPHQYRIDARLRHARLRLASGCSVTESCLDAGFESVGTFSYLFKRRVGLTPSEFRRSVRATVTVPGVLSPIYFPGCLSMMAQLPASAFSQF